LKSVAKNVKVADIGVCQEQVVKDPEWAHEFARDVIHNT